MPLSPRGDRVVSKSKLMRQERAMARIAHDAITQYLALVRAAVAHTAVTAAAGQDGDLGPDVDLNHVDQAAAWPAILDATIMPEIAALTLGLGPQGDLPGAAVTQINAWRAKWLDDRRQELVGVPDSITKQIRDAIQASSDTHGPSPQHAATIVKDLLNPDAPTWKSRAMTIARTEVVGANNQGGLASWRAVHHSLADQGAQVLKTWLATEDSRTRPDHVGIDGTEVPMGQSFSVGGYQMDGPGDPTAPPEEVINCRCTLTYRVDDSADAPADDDQESITAAVEAPVTAPADVTDAPSPAPVSPPVSAAPGAPQWEGVLAVLDTPSSDRRVIASAGFTVRQLPLPLKYQALGSHGGEESGTTEIVGRILTTEIRGNQVWATGDFFDPSLCYQSTYAMQQVSAGIGCVSLDLPCEITEYIVGPDGSLIPVNYASYIGDGSDLVQVAETSELAAATIVDVPAFADARISLVADPSALSTGPIVADAATPDAPILTSEDITFPDGTVLKVGDQVNIVGQDGADPTSGLIELISPDDNTVTVAVEDPAVDGGTTTVTVDASQIDVIEDASTDDTPADAAPAAAGLTAAALAFPGLTEEHVYPAEWFEPVALDAPTRLTISPEGRVFGHLAQADTCHAGFPGQCVTPPESPSNYAYFHMGEVKTTAGMIAAGKITVGGGHANLRLGWRGAVEHYDNACSVVAVARAYRDEHGIQVAGALLPNATGDQIAGLRRSPLSGDWREIGGHRELIIGHCVNDPGFPIAPRAALAADGHPMSLVAAGVVYGPPSDVEPEAATVTLPSGLSLTAADISVLASAFAEAIDQRKNLTMSLDSRSGMRAQAAELRRNLARQALKARLRSVS